MRPGRNLGQSEIEIQEAYLDRSARSSSLASATSLRAELKMRPCSAAEQYPV